MDAPPSPAGDTRASGKEGAAKPPNDYSYSKAVMRSALLFDTLVAAGVPEVKAVWAHEIGGARMFTVVAITEAGARALFPNCGNKLVMRGSGHAFESLD